MAPLLWRNGLPNKAYHPTYLPHGWPNRGCVFWANSLCQICQCSRCRFRFGSRRGGGGIFSVAGKSGEQFSKFSDDETIFPQDLFHQSTSTLPLFITCSLCHSLPVQQCAIYLTSVMTDNCRSRHKLKDNQNSILVTPVLSFSKCLFPPKCSQLDYVLRVFSGECFRHPSLLFIIRFPA